MKWVKYDKDNQRIPIKSWCDQVEDGAMEQAMNLARHPVLFHHVALMPDCHLGYGMPIGGVIACDKAVIPFAVGSDAGCGMASIKTDFPANLITREAVEHIMAKVELTIPVGLGKWHKEKQTWGGFDDAPDIPIIQKELNSARYQLGTLGSGNHFIELQAGDDGFIWLMIHSGSRNFGYKIANEYHKKALILCERWKSDIPDKELAFLPIETKEGKEYLEAMNYALGFARESRYRMISEFFGIVNDIIPCKQAISIDIHHNYAAWENHFGKNVLVHRKGATLARKGVKGIIPGSMGTPSYIVEGLGNPDSFNSCSHGAGRVMGRRDASRTLLEGDCEKAMEGIVFGGWGTDRKGNIDLGEAPQAYKNIDTVIEAELDLIKPLVKLRPLGVVKG